MGSRSLVEQSDGALRCRPFLPEPLLSAVAGNLSNGGLPEADCCRDIVSSHPVIISQAPSNRVTAWPHIKTLPSPHLGTAPSSLLSTTAVSSPGHHSRNAPTLSQSYILTLFRSASRSATPLRGIHSTSTTEMLFNVTLKKDASPEELEKAKEQAKKDGGVIKHEYTLIKGFTVEYPDDHVNTLQTTDHVHVEQDGEVKTQ